jgi:hypothetical protein
MIGSISRRWWFGMLGLVWLGAIGQAQAQAWDKAPVKVNTKFEFRIEVTTKPQFAPPTAPWYAYFPADARLLPSMQTTPYPTWPAPFPPQGPPPNPIPNAPKSMGTAAAPPGPMLTQYWPNHYNNASNVQPIGYVPSQVPSYWYQNR